MLKQGSLQPLRVGMVVARSFKGIQKSLQCSYGMRVLPALGKGG